MNVTWTLVLLSLFGPGDWEVVSSIPDFETSASCQSALVDLAPTAAKAGVVVALCVPEAETREA